MSKAASPRWIRVRRKPVEIRAFRWWGQEVEGFERVPMGDGPGGTTRYALYTGDGRADEGDWIVEGLGEVKVVDHATFEALYEVLG